MTISRLFSKKVLSILSIISKIFEKIISKKLQTLWTHYYQTTNVSFEKVLVHKIVYWQF